MNEREALLLQAFERAGEIGLVREYPDFEAFAVAWLDMIGQPDTPVNRSKIGFGHPGSITPMMAGSETRTYFIAVIPPTTRFHAAGETALVDQLEANARIVFCVVTQADERRFLAARRQT